VRVVVSYKSIPEIIGALSVSVGNASTYIGKGYSKDYLIRDLQRLASKSNQNSELIKLRRILMLTELAFLTDFTLLGDKAEDDANKALYRALKGFNQKFRKGEQ